MAYAINWKEVFGMPRMDGTGPWGLGAKAGFAGWRCRGANWRGRQFGQGYGRGLGLCRWMPTDNQEMLLAQKAMLQERLAEVDEQLQNQ
jgi:hypothetical protein